MGMYLVMILEAAQEDLRNIVAYISNENPDLAETFEPLLIPVKIERRAGEGSFFRGG
jgi:hypothetical protein